jgi:hypothetical protein
MKEGIAQARITGQASRTTTRITNSEGALRRRKMRFSRSLKSKSASVCKRGFNVKWEGQVLFFTLWLDGTPVCVTCCSAVKNLEI